ncbi:MULTISPECIES: CPBP family intramembrane glutamic endopeptidase [Streptococcus]|uniref:Membrane protease YdiL (CAAX protease family) n=1 Tax=Streptococcus porcorum TaxID=701526 RepID=A0ABV2JCR0_9STRE
MVDSRIYIADKVVERIITAGLVAPIIEELLFRGFYVEVLTENYSKRVAI